MNHSNIVDGSRQVARGALLALLALPLAALSQAPASSFNRQADPNTQVAPAKPPVIDPATLIRIAPAAPATALKPVPGVAQSLNPQPLPPKPANPAAAAKPVPGVAQSLNPQPLPPRPANPVVAAPGAIAAGATAGNALAAKPTALPANLFSQDDRAIIIVSGKPVPAGSVKNAIKASLVKAGGAPKTVKGGSRKLDLAALGVVGAGGGKSVALASRIAKPVAVLPQRPAGDFAQAKGNGAAANAINAATCRDKGPPRIDAGAVKLRAGASVALTGLCFGDRPGHVEIIGQFPGGKLRPAFTAWDMTGVTIQMPADIRGAIDHAAAVTIVTAEGKVSTALQAQYVAARERVDVPDARWGPNAIFDAIDAGDIATYQNKAYRGTVAKTVRVNPQCVLDAMDLVFVAGGGSVQGFEQGPPNESSVTITWQGQCSSQTTSTRETVLGLPQGVDVSFASACHVAFQARAWAYCPAGVAP